MPIGHVRRDFIYLGGTVVSYLFSVAMGFLQGVAEFLPISSSGHLALFQYFFGGQNPEETDLLFTVLLHFGTLVAVCVYYWESDLCFPKRAAGPRRPRRPVVWC